MSLTTTKTIGVRGDDLPGKTADLIADTVKEEAGLLEQIGYKVDPRSIRVTEGLVTSKTTYLAIEMEANTL